MFELAHILNISMEGREEEVRGLVRELMVKEGINKAVTSSS